MPLLLLQINRAKASNPLEALALGAKELGDLTKGVVKGVGGWPVADALAAGRRSGWEG